ncbi:MAG: response regulator [Sedimentisphaerales bacterium]|nr:response regulator [Sedimentisphaerales bacterium]
MRFLIAEDDFATRRLMQKYLSDYGNCDIAVNGIEAVEAFRLSLDEFNPYDLIYLDIMMSRMDGSKALQEIRKIELERNIEYSNYVKVIITTACEDSKNIIGSFREGCEAYLVKPIDRKKLIREMAKLGLIVLFN